MAEVSTFRATLVFFDKLGVYDVLLPFLLVFTLVFAILEKTKVLGMDTIEGSQYTKKNLNAMVAFVIGFLTVASSQVVAIINETAAHIVILLLISVFFLMLAGSFMKETNESFYLEGAWKWIFMGIMFVGLIFIFMDAIRAPNGNTWLETLWYWLLNMNNSITVSSVIMIVVFIGIIWFITRDSGKGKKSSD